MQIKPVIQKFCPLRVQVLTGETEVLGEKHYTALVLDE